MVRFNPYGQVRMFLDALVTAATLYTIGAIPLTIAFEDLLRKGTSTFVASATSCGLESLCLERTCMIIIMHGNSALYAKMEAEHAGIAIMHADQADHCPLRINKPFLQLLLCIALHFCRHIGLALASCCTRQQCGVVHHKR